jgi:hypothetical protein
MRAKGGAQETVDERLRAVPQDLWDRVKAPTATTQPRLLRFRSIPKRLIGWTGLPVRANCETAKACVMHVASDPRALLRNVCTNAHRNATPCTVMHGRMRCMW